MNQTQIITLSEAISLYNVSLNSEGTIKIGGIEFDAAYALYRLDFIAYKVGFFDFLSALELEVPGYISDIDFDRNIYN